MPNSYEELRMYLVSDDIDQPRSIEYLISIVDERRVMRSFSSKKNFTKTRFVINRFVSFCRTCVYIVSAFKMTVFFNDHRSQTKFMTS